MHTALGKYGQNTALRQNLRRPPQRTPVDLTAVDRDGPIAVQNPTDRRVVQHVVRGQVFWRVGQHNRQQGRFQPAKMIGHHDQGPSGRQVFAAMHLEAQQQPGQQADRDTQEAPDEPARP